MVVRLMEQCGLGGHLVWWNGVLRVDWSVEGGMEEDLRDVGFGTWGGGTGKMSEEA